MLNVIGSSRCFECCTHVIDPNLQSFIAATEQLINFHQQNTLIDNNNKTTTNTCDTEKNDGNREVIDDVSKQIIEKPNKKKKTMGKNCKNKTSTLKSNNDSIKVENNKKLSPLFVKSRIRKCKVILIFGIILLYYY